MKSIGNIFHRKSSSLLGFTLVELIVVISILVILGTIAFFSLGGYAVGARDSVRISNLTNLKKGLDIFKIKTGTYPTPESYTTLAMSGKEIIYQGFAKDQVISLAKLSPGASLDPVDATMYTTYATTTDGKRMQLMTFLEDRSTLISRVNSEFFKVYASINTDYSKRFSYTIGDKIGILLNSTGILAPVQEFMGTGNIDLGTTATGYTVYFDNKTINNGTGSELKNAFLSGSIVYVIESNAGATASNLTGAVVVPIPIYDSGALQFLGFDKNLDKVFDTGSAYSSGWTTNSCDSSAVAVYSVLNPKTFFGTGVTLSHNALYKIPNGTYSLTGSTQSDGHIKLGNCTGIIGASKAGVVFNANFSGGSTSATGAMFLIDGKSNAIISSLTVNGNKAGTYKYRDGIKLNAVTNTTIDNLVVSSNQDHGMVTVSASYNTFNNINANTNGSYGIVLHANSNYNNLTNIIASANYIGLMIQVNSDYNNIQNIESHSNTNGSDGHGIYFNGSSNNALTNAKSYNNKAYGLFFYNGSTNNSVKQYIGYNQVGGLLMMLGSNNNTFTDMSINKNSWVGVYMDGITGSIFNNFEIYNNSSGMNFTGSTMNYFNNFHIYNNTGRAINTTYSSKNVYNNYLSYNNGGIANEIEYGDTTLFNKMYVFNNITGHSETPYGLRFYMTTIGAIKDYYSYNNQYYGCISVGSSNITRSGIYKVFGIPNYDTESCGAPAVGNDGTIMACSWHVQPSWMGTSLGATCTNGYYGNSYIGTARATYTFGSSIGNQSQPMKWNTGSNAFIPYGVDGIDYDSTKKVGQW